MKRKQRGQPTEAEKPEFDGFDIAFLHMVLLQDPQDLPLLRNTMRTLDGRHLTHVAIINKRVIHIVFLV